MKKLGKWRCVLWQEAASTQKSGHGKQVAARTLHKDQWGLKGRTQLMPLPSPAQSCHLLALLQGRSGAAVSPPKRTHAGNKQLGPVGHRLALFEKQLCAGKCHGVLTSDCRQTRKEVVIETSY